MKIQENLTNIMGSLGGFWAHLDHLKKDNKGVTDLNNPSELVEEELQDFATAGDRILGGKEY